MVSEVSEFKKVLSKPSLHDGLFLFLQNIYHLYPEDRFFALIKEVCTGNDNDESVYRGLQARLGEIKPFLGDIFYALPALKKQKAEMARQTLGLLKGVSEVNGYVEIGSTGRYVAGLKSGIKLHGDIVLINDQAPTNSLGDIFERGQFAKVGRFVALNNYQPISSSDIADSSVDLVTCYIGIHHAPLDLLDGFVRSIWRILRPGGRFILRDHDANSDDMKTFASLIHTVFNAGLGVPCETNQKEHRFFRPVSEWVQYLDERGFKDHGDRLLQANDPSLNLLMLFTKKGNESRK